MTMFQEVRVETDVPALSALAHEIWTEYYMPLLGAEQIAYMLKKLQSESPMRKQLTHDDYRYFFLKHGEETAGYLGVQIQNSAIFLSKLYVKQAYRGRGTARDVMAFLEGWAHGARLCKIWLTVNRGNESSVRSYERMGFLNVGTQDADIGEGYVMNDFIFEKRI